MLAAASLLHASQSSPALPAVTLAEEAFKRRDFAGAIAIARQALEHGENAHLRDVLGKSYAASQDPEAAQRELQIAVRLEPNVEEFQFDLGQFLLRSQRFQTALTALEQAHQRLPKSAQIELALGVAQYCCTRYNDAVRTFLRTMELEPDIVQPYRFLGDALEHADAQLPEIARHCVVAERLNPSNADALLLHARVLVAEHGNAAHLLERVIALDPRSSTAYFMLGCLMADQGNVARAADLLAKSVQLNPNNPGAHYRLGLLYARLGHRAKADEEFAAQAALKQQTRQVLPLE